MTELLGVGVGAWLVLALGAVAVGFSKTAVNGTVMVAVILFASVLPIRESTGALLVILLVGDLIAVRAYRHDAHWHLLRSLIAPVLVGLVAGAAFLAFAPSTVLRPAIGAIVVVMVSVQAIRMLREHRSARRDLRAAPAGDPRGTGSTAGVGTPSTAENLAATSAPGSRRGAGFGALAGFTTMVANAGGSVMTLYLLRSRLDVVAFVGTMAWFFFAVNLAKLPFSIGLGLVQPSRLLLCLTLVPAVLLGAVIGRAIILRVPRRVFEWVVLAVAGVSGLVLALT